MNYLQLSENLLSTRNGDLAGVALVLGIGDLAVVKDHSPAAAANSQHFCLSALGTSTYFLSPIPAAQP